MEFVELESLEKGGAIENEILVDDEGHFHLFLEHANGTSPHAHIKYVYDPNHEKYATKMEWLYHFSFMNNVICLNKII